MSTPPIKSAQVYKDENSEVSPTSDLKPKKPIISLADVLKEPGFVPDLERDRHYGKQLDQTLSEMHGRPSFCQKFVEWFEQDPNAYPDLKAAVASAPNSTYRTNLLTLITKMVWHLLSFKGSIPIEKGLCQLEGFSETFVIPEVLRRWNEFVKGGFVPQEIDTFVANILQSAAWHDRCSEQKLKSILSDIQNPSYRGPILIGSGWAWHSTYVVFYKDPEDSENEIRMGYCNRGADCDEGGISGIVFLKIRDKSKITLEFLQVLANRIEVDHSEYKSLKKIKEELQAEEIGCVAMKKQKVGNCTYANLKAALYALLLINQLGKNLDAYLKINKLDTELNDIQLKLTQEQKTALSIYKKFSSYEANQTLRELQDFSLSNEMLPVPLDYAQAMTVVINHLKSKKADPVVLESLRCSIKACPALDKAEEQVQEKQWEAQAILVLWDEIYFQLCGLPLHERPMKMPEFDNPNQIRTWLRSNVATLAKITELNLSDTQLKVLPKEIQYCTQLQKLDLYNTPITSFANLRLPQLQTLNLSSTPLIHISNLQLPQLQTLNLSNCQLTSFPADFQLPQLQNLDLRNNNLTALPENLQLPELQVLSLCYNQLTSLPADLQLPQLKNLDLRNNKLSSLPADLQLPRLREIFLSDNQLTSIPDLQLPELQDLDATHNRLTSAPNIELMPKLTCLMLNDNHLSQAPDILMISNLTLLTLDRNRLTHFPDAHLPQMRHLGLTGNPFTSVPNVQAKWPQCVSL